MSRYNKLGNLIEGGMDAATLTFGIRIRILYLVYINGRGFASFVL